MPPMQVLKSSLLVNSLVLKELNIRKIYENRNWFNVVEARNDAGNSKLETGRDEHRESNHELRYEPR